MMRKKTSLIFSFAATVALATTPVVAQETQSWLRDGVLRAAGGWELKVWIGDFEEERSAASSSACLR